MVNSNLEYYLTNYINKISNKIVKIGYFTSLYNRLDKKNINSKKNLNEKIIKKKYKFLTKYNYNKNINIDEINKYTVLNVNIDTSDSLKIMAKKLLENILNSKKILVDNNPVQFKDCVILDIIDTSKVTFSGFHTDVEYNNFTGNSFNVWYLIENKKSYGNIFILESDDYKKEYTPCYVKKESNDKEISNYDKHNIIDLHRHSFFYNHTIQCEKIGTLKKFKIIYANIKNGECLIMSKHVIHKGDSRRNGNVNGFHFRVLVKNDDGSIDYDKYYKASKKFPNHKWDRENKKLFGVELFDFA
jgi:hypothetical protein